MIAEILLNLASNFHKVALYKVEACPLSKTSAHPTRTEPFFFPDKFGNGPEFCLYLKKVKKKTDR